MRLSLMQKACDVAVGLNKAGYVIGYCGSPVGAVDIQMERAKNVLSELDVTFQRAPTKIWLQRPCGADNRRNCALRGPVSEF
ncbi:MAG: hypothetical protein OSA51_12380 [Octadecabacter sp.]|nr:hypothetical protein [Octadecabacter sp.]